MGVAVGAANRTVGHDQRSARLGSGPGDNYDSRRWLALPVVLSATFMSLFDIFVVNVAAPSIQHDLQASSATLQLLVAGYSFSYAAGLVTGARLGDLYGRRRLFIFGLLLFASASLLCGLAPTAGLLLAGRLAQGLGAAAMVPQVLALATVSFPPEERPRVFSLFGATVGLGTVAGQVLGGVFLNLNILGLGWRPIFLVNVPIGVTAAVLARRLLPESRPPLADRLDLLGVALLSAGIGAVIVPLVLGREVHWAAWTFASLVAGALLLAAFRGLGAPAWPAWRPPSPAARAVRASRLQHRAAREPGVLCVLWQPAPHSHGLFAGRAPRLPAPGRPDLRPARDSICAFLARRPHAFSRGLARPRSSPGRRPRWRESSGSPC